MPTAEVMPTPEVMPTTEIMPTPEVMPTTDVMPTPEVMPTKEVMPTTYSMPTPEVMAEGRSITDCRWQYGRWSSCSDKCVKTRTRIKIQDAVTGGKECEDSAVDSTPCYNNECAGSAIN